MGGYGYDCSSACGEWGNAVLIHVNFSSDLVAEEANTIMGVKHYSHQVELYLVVYIVVDQYIV